MIDYCRNFIKKSRSFIAGIPGGNRIDIFLFIAVVVVLLIIASGQIFRSVERFRRTDISVSQQGIQFFGADVFGALVREFEEQYPDLRIQVVQSADADIVFFDDSEISGLMAESALASLKPYIHSETPAGQWVIPLVSFMDLFFYNIGILQAANCDRPPKTRAEFLAAARAVAALNGPSPLALGLSEADPLALRRDIYPWVWAAGGNLRQAGAEEAVLSRTANDTIAFFGQLYREGLLAPDSFDKAGAQRLEEFAAGNIAMLAASSRDISFLQSTIDGFGFGITAMPQMAPGGNRLALSGVYAGISGGCTLPDEAWTFLAFIAGRKQVLEEALGAIPGNFPSAFPADYATADPLLAKAWEIFEAADIVEYFPAAPLEEETDRIIWEKIAEAFQAFK